MKFMVAVVKSIGGGASLGLNGVDGGARNSLEEGVIGDAKVSSGNCTDAGKGDAASVSCVTGKGGHVTPPTATSGAACSTWGCGGHLTPATAVTSGVGAGGVANGTDGIVDPAPNC